jgi:hypothetical protein
MTIKSAQRIAIDFLNDNIVSENVNEAIRLLVSKTMTLTVGEVTSKLGTCVYVNIIDGVHSIVYCKVEKLSAELKMRTVKWIMSESKYSIQIYI